MTLELETILKDLYKATNLEGKYSGDGLEVVEGEFNSDYPKLWNASGTQV